jgi:hypothetical protein
MKGAELPRPALAQDGVGSSGNGNRTFTLLPGKTPLGEPIVKKKQPEAQEATPTLGEEINAYLEERARLREQGLLPRPEDKPPIVTPADVISDDLHVLLFNLGNPETDEQWAKYNSIDSISFVFDTLAFGLISQPMQEYIAVMFELTQGFNRNRPDILEKHGRVKGEDTVILAEQLQKVGLPFHARPQGITIPFASTVAKMREIAGGEPLWEIPSPNLTHIENHRRNR